MMSEDTKSNQEKFSMGYKGVKRLAREKPAWLPIVEACLKLAKEYSEFAGTWVLEEVKRKNFLWQKGKMRGKPWFSNLRTLVSYGILRKTDVAQGGRRAYYIIPDIEGVERAIKNIYERMGERKEKYTLKDLKRKNLITIKDPSSAGSSNLMDMTIAPNKIFLKRVILIDEKKEIRLICETKSGSSREGKIKSQNLELLKEIKEALETFRNQTISEVFSTRFKVSKNFLRNEEEM